MKNCFIGVIVLLSAMSATMCKKVPTTHDKIDTFLTNNFYYKVGSYWIYKDALTSLDDSFAVTSSVFSSLPVGNNEVIDGIQISVNQYDNSNNLFGTWQWSISGSSIKMQYNGDVYIDYNFFITIPYAVGSLGGFNDEDSGYVSSINGIDTIVSAVYSDVVKIIHQNDYDSVFAHFNDTFYFNKEFGINRMSLNRFVKNSWQRNEWQLERYKFIR